MNKRSVASHLFQTRVDVPMQVPLDNTNTRFLTYNSREKMFHIVDAQGKSISSFAKDSNMYKMLYKHYQDLDKQWTSLTNKTKDLHKQLEDVQAKNKDLHVIVPGLEKLLKKGFKS